MSEPKSAMQIFEQVEEAILGLGGWAKEGSGGMVGAGSFNRDSSFFMLPSADGSAQLRLNVYMEEQSAMEERARRNEQGETAIHGLRAEMPMGELAKLAAKLPGEYCRVYANAEDPLFNCEEAVYLTPLHAAPVDPAWKIPGSVVGCEGGVILPLADLRNYIERGGERAVIIERGNEEGAAVLLGGAICSMDFTWKLTDGDMEAELAKGGAAQ